MSIRSIAAAGSSVSPSFLGASAAPDPGVAPSGTAGISSWRRISSAPEPLISPEILRAAQKAAVALYEEEAAKNPSWKKIYEPWKKFRGEEFLWHRAAEFTYESFVYNNPFTK